MRINSLEKKKNTGAENQLDEKEADSFCPDNKEVHVLIYTIKQRHSWRNRLHLVRAIVASNIMSICSCPIPATSLSFGK